MGWLTTGQMVDELSPNEIATSKEGDKCYYAEIGELIFEPCARKFEDNDFSRRMNIAYKNDLWTIEPQYVSFEEAMKESKKGKQVRLHNSRLGHFVLDEEDACFELKHSDLSNYSLRELVEGKWSVE